MNTETLNRLADIINTNSHVFNSVDLSNLQAIQNELERDMILFEKEIEYSERLIHENVKLKMRVNKYEMNIL